MFVLGNRNKINFQLLKFFCTNETVKKRIFSWSFNTHSVVHVTLIRMEVENKNETCSLKCYDLIGFMLFTHKGLGKKKKIKLNTIKYFISNWINNNNKKKQTLLLYLISSTTVKDSSSIDKGISRQTELFTYVMLYKISHY